MVTNVTDLQSATNFYDIIEYTNDVTEGIMGSMFMVVLFILLIALFIKRYSIEASLAVSSFICFGISLMLVSIGLLSAPFLIFFGTIMGFSSFWLAMTKK